MSISRAIRCGWLAVASVAVGLWLTLPPIELRTPAPSACLIGVAAVVGVWMTRSGQRRFGIAVVVAGLLTLALVLAATRVAPIKLESVVVWSALVASTLSNAAPLLFTAVGGLISERSGVINIGLEGTMLLGAFFGLFGSVETGSWIGGLVIAGAAGAFVALIFGAFAIHLRADQIVGGVAVNLLGVGITGYLLVQLYGTNGTPENLSGIPDVHLGFLQHVYFLGPAFGSLNLMVWAGFALVIVTHLILFRTPLGLRLRAVGEKPEAAETAGISVLRYRYLAVAVSGALGALGGAYLSIGFVHSFTENMTAGRGYIALAAVVLGGWRPFGAFGAVVLFGFSSALALRLPALSASAATLFQALPYVITLVVVAGLVGRSRAPAADGVPYRPR